MADKIKREKIFLNAMDSWFSNFLIETFRTDHLPESKLQTEFMGTINDKKRSQLPMYFEPKIFNFDYNTSYKSDIFNNDIIIYNLNTGSLKEVDYIIRGLKSTNFDSEKILILISNILTWGKTPDKLKTEDPNEIVFIHPLDIKPEKPKEEVKETEEVNEEENPEANKENNTNEENNEHNKTKEEIKDKENKENKENESNASKADVSHAPENTSVKNNEQIKEEPEEEKPIYVYYTEKDYLKRKPNVKYIDYKYIENEAILLNQKNNVKAYVVCPGIIYGYGEQTFYSIFRNAILGLPIEEILLDKGRNIIPTIHMKDLINIISKIIEKKPSTYYILAFDQSNNRSLNHIIKSIYDCAGDINKLIPPKEEEPVEENEENKEGENNAENEEQKDANNTKNHEKNEENNNEGNENEQGDKEGNSEDKKSEELLPEKKRNPIFTDKKYIMPKYFPRENAEKDKVEYNPLFKWHAPEGIMSNPQSIRKEFTKYRNLNSNKILILGNPYTGKTELSSILSKVFHLPIINAEMIVEFGKKLAGIGNENEEQEKAEDTEFKKNERRNSIERDLIRDIQKTMKELDENKAIAEENYNKRKDKKKTDPPFDDKMYYRFNDEMMVRMLKRRLQENDTSVYGFILDGFPKNYQQAQELFEDYDKGGMIPNSILIFENAEDDFLINRLKASESFPKDQKDPQAVAILERSNRRLGKIKENKTQEDYKEISEFFKDEKFENIFKLLILDPKKDILDLVKESQDFILSNNENKINQIDEMLNCTNYTYDYIKEETLRRQKEEELQKEMENEKNKDKKGNDKDKNKKPEEKPNEAEQHPEEKVEEKKEEENVQEKSKEEEKNEEQIEVNKENEIEEDKKEVEMPKTQYEIEKENEYKLLEKKSEILRRYLAENVLPLLSLGILQVANDRPDDPVEALADFLLAKTFENEQKELEKKSKQKEENGNENKNEAKKDENNEPKKQKSDEIDFNINEAF